MTAGAICSLVLQGVPRPANAQHSFVTAVGPSRGLHLQLTRVRKGLTKVELADGDMLLLSQAGEPRVAEGGVLSLLKENVAVAHSSRHMHVVRTYALPGQMRLRCTHFYQILASGEIELKVSLESTAAASVWLAPTFLAETDVHSSWIHRKVESASEERYESPGPYNEFAPLPTLGISALQRTYALASGSTWDFPMQGSAEPHLVVEGKALSSPQIGTAAVPIKLQAGQQQTWLTLIARNPRPIDSEPQDQRAREYALELGAQIAIYNAFSQQPPISVEDNKLKLHDLAAKHFAAICFATAYWSRITTPNGAHSVTPAAHYNPGTWMRDSFWTIMGLGGSLLEAPTEAEILRSYVDAIPRSATDAGHVPLLLTFPGAISFTDESGLYFLIRMYRDSKVLSLPVADRALAALVLKYTLQNQVKDGRFLTGGPKDFHGHPFSPDGWLDGYGYSAGDMLTSNQGLFVLALEAAEGLGVPLEPGLRDKAKDAYRATYSPSLGYMRWLGSKDYRSPDVLMGEALGLLLFNHPILPDDLVTKTLGAQIQTSFGMRVLADGDGSFVSSAEFLNTTNGGHPEEPAGWYQNGGSWLLWEYLAGYAARRHEDPKACASIAQSIRAEVQVTPTLKEFKLTALDPDLSEINDPRGNRELGTTDDNRQGHGWNAAIVAFQRSLQQHDLGCEQID